jgi:hypothetical protein
MPATIELHIRRMPDQSLVADATLISAASATPALLAAAVPVTINSTELLALNDDPAAYGATLRAQIFAAPALRRAQNQACAYTGADDVVLRLRIDLDDSELQAIRWETLHSFAPPTQTPAPVDPRPDRQKVIDVGSAQIGEMRTGDIAGGNITHTTINLWGWDRLGQDMLNRLIEQIDKNARLKRADKAQLKDDNRHLWAQINWTQAAETYRQEVLRLYGSMQIFGMSRPVPLTNVFTEVYLLDKPSAWRRHSIEELKKGTPTQASPVAKDKRREGVALVTAQSRLFILGQPGAGKTTFLKHLVMQAAQGQLDAIPIFVSLKAWSDSKLDLMPFLIRQFAICSFPDARPFIEHILTEGKALVLFDGLDEVNYEGGRHWHTTQAIREFAQQYGKSRMVITCRTAATEFTFEQFNYCELADFTQKQIEAFVQRWFQSDVAKRAAFLSAFARPENQRLGELAHRPLLLTMLCLTFEETMAFPQRRAELYEEAIDALLKKWDSSRSIQRDQIYRKLSLGYKRQLLSELAAQSFERSEFFIARRELAERVVRFLRRLPPTDQSEQIDGAAVLRAIEAQHGLLIERARDIYSFSHLTFHEYFAARYIADYPEEHVLRGAVAQAANPQWREVLLLSTSMLDHRSANLLFQIWSMQLLVQLRDNPTLAEMMAWTREQAQLIAPGDIGLRAAILTITIIDQAIQTNQAIIGLLTYAVADASVLASTRDHALASARSIDRALASARSIDHSIDRNLASARALASAFAKSLAIDCDRSLANALKHSSASASVVASIFASSLDRASSLDQALASASTSASAKIAARFTPNHTNEQRYILNDLPQKEWAITKEQMNILGKHLSSTNLLLECLDLAAIEDRQAVLDRLLVPPEK